MSTAIKFAPRYTIDDYRLWQGEWELWDGIAIAMTPSPFGRHQRVLFALVYELTTAIRNQSCNATALGELDWIVCNDTVVRPDVIVVCGEVPDKHLEQPPALIAEVLSPSTRQNDLTYKRDLFASQGVGTYLIVDPDAKTIEQLTLTSSGNYESIDASSRLEVTVCGDCTLRADWKRVFTR